MTLINKLQETCIYKGNFSSIYLKNNKIVKRSKINNVTKEHVLHELLILNSNLSPYLIHCNSFSISKNNLELTMPYYKNGTLDHFIKDCIKMKEEIPENVIWLYFLQLIQGLRVLHKNNIIHRDLKPSNIFITDFFNVKIGDFNSSKILQINQKYTSTCIGTPMFMSPEVINGESYSYDIDIWALGCILYECITKKQPFYSDNWGNLIVKISLCNVCPIEREDISIDLKKWCYNLLQEKRPNIETIHRKTASLSLDYGVKSDGIIKHKVFSKMVSLSYEYENISEFIKKLKNDSVLVNEEQSKELNASVKNNLLVSKCKLFNKKRKI